ncbi:MAG: sugar translocase [Pusillimonas sp.]|jgi:putative flippase GtrA|nr:sugar translocase [Pusillimonas sp.]
MKSTLKQLVWFVAVGCSAAATHWLVVVAFVSGLHTAPLLANVIGWLVAFSVSFTGHYLLTFRHQHAPLWQAVRRFFLVSALGFTVNEASYALLLSATTIRYDILLAFILIAIAVLTFILGRFWAFRGARHPH